MNPENAQLSTHFAPFPARFPRFQAQFTESGRIFPILGLEKSIFLCRGNNTLIISELIAPLPAGTAQNPRRRMNVTPFEDSEHSPGGLFIMAVLWRSGRGVRHSRASSGQFREMDQALPAGHRQPTEADAGVSGRPVPSHTGAARLLR